MWPRGRNDCLATRRGAGNIGRSASSGSPPPRCRASVSDEFGSSGSRRPENERRKERISGHSWGFDGTGGLEDRRIPVSGESTTSLHWGSKPPRRTGGSSRRNPLSPTSNCTASENTWYERLLNV